MLYIQLLMQSILTTFNTATKNDKIPDDLKKIRKPIIGYFGGISERVNLKLIKKVALKFTNANVVLIGKKLNRHINVEHFRKCSFVRTKEISNLPEYLKHFSVCLIPYQDK